MQSQMTSYPVLEHSLIERGSASATHFICSSDTRMLFVAAVDTWTSIALKLVAKGLAIVI